MNINIDIEDIVNKKNNDKNNENNDENNENKTYDLSLINLNEINNMLFSDDEICINLKLLAKLKPNEKLIFDNKKTKLFSVDNSLLQSITRYYYGYDRITTIYYIDQLVNITLDKINILYLNKKIYDQLNKYINELKNVTEGLINLKITYSGDQLIQSKLDYIIEKIRYNIMNDKYY